MHVCDFLHRVDCNLKSDHCIPSHTLVIAGYLQVKKAVPLQAGFALRVENCCSPMKLGCLKADGWL